MTTKGHTSKVGEHKLAHPRFILLDGSRLWKEVLGSDRAVECKRRSDIVNILTCDWTDSLWISSSSQMTDSLLKAIIQSKRSASEINRRSGSLLTLKSPQPSTVPFLRTLFHNLVGETEYFKWLPSDQLVEVLAGDPITASNVFIGGVIDTQLGLLTLVRGNLDRITVPLSIFRASGTSKPDFGQFELDDYGHSVRFGKYEASAHFILYEADPEYRKHSKKKERACEKGFGGALRRLRVLKGISQAGFPGISARTIGRIENGEIAKPHSDTVRTISQTLGVEVEDIESY